MRNPKTYGPETIECSSRMVAPAGAYVAFDLDKTLGFFEVTNPLAYFWSPELVENPEVFAANPGLKPVSKRLRNKLKRASDLFATKLLARKDLLDLVLRTNLDAMVGPLLAARRAGHIRAVIIYSNSTHYGSLELAKTLIERKFRCHGFFELLADAFHPLRDADQPPVPVGYEYIEPVKTYPVLQILFAEAQGLRTVPAIPPKQVLFFDDRHPKHELKWQEREGLHYIMPKPFHPKLTAAQKAEFIALAMSAMEESGLLKDTEYLESVFCKRTVVEYVVERRELRGFPDVYALVKRRIGEVRGAPNVWTEDTLRLRGATIDALRVAMQ